MKKSLGFLAGVVLAVSAAFSALAQTSVVQSVDNVQNRQATYGAASSFTLAATPTVVWELAGSATRTVHVRSVSISCTKTADGIANVQLIKYSAAATGGTAVATTEVSYDTANAANTAQARHFTAEPTPGAAVGTVAIKQGIFAAPAGTATVVPTVFTFGEGMEQQLILRGVAQNVAINMGAATLTGAICAVTARWMER